MMAEDLTQAWADKKLTPEQIHLYLETCIAPDMARENSVGLAHVADLCHHLYLWSWQQYDLGSFLTAVKDNNLSNAVMYADDVNKTALWIYVAFLYNVAPSGWQKRNEVKKEEVQL